MFQKNISLIFIFAMTLCSPGASADSFEGRWQDIGVSLSGLAKMEPARNNATMSFVGIVDSKSSGEPRVVIVNLDNEYRASVTAINWPESDPDDLESIAAIPNGKTWTEQQFVAVNSSGEFWRFTIDQNDQLANILEGERPLTQEGSTNKAKEIESVAFFINQNSGLIKWVWAGRGSRDHPAYLFSADLTNNSSSISYSDTHHFKIQETAFSWLRPKWSEDDNSRLISDLKVADNGKIYFSSAFDGGDNGPFSGVLYNLGTFEKSSKIDPSSSPLAPLTPTFSKGIGKKVEALELINSANPSDGFILGSDDEDLGGSVLVLIPSEH